MNIKPYIIAAIMTLSGCAAKQYVKNDVDSFNSINQTKVESIDNVVDKNTNKELKKVNKNNDYFIIVDGNKIKREDTLYGEVDKLWLESTSFLKPKEKEMTPEEIKEVNKGLKKFSEYGLNWK